MLFKQKVLHTIFNKALRYMEYYGQTNTLFKHIYVDMEITLKITGGCCTNKKYILLHSAKHYATWIGRGDKQLPDCSYIFTMI